MANPHIVYILPTGGKTPGHLLYARDCLHTLLRKSAPARLDVIVVDDASADWNETWCTKGLPDLPEESGRVWVHHFAQWGGLTRSWNHGFRLARTLRPDYIVAGNDDVLVPHNWWVGLAAACKTCDIVGPLSNAPGRTEGGQQDVRKWMDGYELDDNPDAIDAVCNHLRRRWSKVVPSPINGFFMFAPANKWWRFGYDNRHVFPPAITVMPSGRPNITPLMTGQEDWLHARIKAMGGSTGAALASFVFHYRSVSRGMRYAACGGQWHRREGRGYV